MTAKRYREHDAAYEVLRQAETQAAKRVMALAEANQLPGEVMVALGDYMEAARHLAEKQREITRLLRSRI